MKLTTLSIITLASLAAAVGSAGAADLQTPYEPNYRTRDYTSASSHWNGAYVGAQGGFAWDHDDLTVSYAGVGSASTTNDLHGGFGGVHLGYNIVRGNFLVGVEGDAELGGLRGTVTASDAIGDSVSGSTNINFQASARLRAGVLPSPGTLFYVTGGLALANIKDTYSATAVAGNPLSVTPGTYSESFSATRLGYTLGAGIEKELSRNIRGRIEYRFSDYGSYNNSNSTTLPGLQVSQKLTDQAVRVGASAAF